MSLRKGSLQERQDEMRSRMRPNAKRLTKDEMLQRLGSRFRVCTNDEMILKYADRISKLEGWDVKPSTAPATPQGENGLDAVLQMEKQ